MKKSILFFTFILGIATIDSAFGAFERLRNFFGGGRYYYYDNGYYYPSGRRYYYTYSYPAYTYPRYYSKPGYYYESVVNPRAIDTNVTEDESKYIVTVVLPGYNKSDIKVSALDRSIQVNANAPATVQGSTLPQVRTIEHIVPFNEPIKPEAVTSSYENGILTLTAPKLYARQAVSVLVK